MRQQVLLSCVFLLGCSAESQGARKGAAGGFASGVGGDASNQAGHSGAGGRSDTGGSLAGHIGGDAGGATGGQTGTASGGSAVQAMPCDPLKDSCYTNPVGGDIRMGDPYVFYHEGVYYLYGSNYQSGFRVFTSSNLKDWKDGGIAYRNADPSCKTNFWAPEVHPYLGKFYLIFSCQTDSAGTGFQLVIASSTAPTGPFANLKIPWITGEGANIDAHLFVDGATPYLFFDKVGSTDKYVWGSIYAVELTPDLQTMKGTPTLMVQASQPWELPNGVNRTNEGAFVFKRNDRYYMTYSGNTYTNPNYAVGYASADHPLGPWTKSETNPVLRRDPVVDVSGPGHSSMVLSPDGAELFIVYHAHADPRRPSGDRTVNIDRVLFDNAGAMRILGPTRSPQGLPSGAR